jgi:7,8-dihydro-6-hydroxymethylpterin dimethyltransferase
LDVYVILSLNTFDPEVSRRLHGRDLTAIKQQAVENLARAGVRMTLLHVLIRDVTENALGRILELMRQYDHILSLTVQTMTYTGQGGGQFPRARHVPVDEAAKIVSRESGGALTPNDFITRPSAHPLCYLVSYLLKSGDRLLPFARFAANDEIRRLLADSYLLRPAAAEDFFTDAINQLYAAGQTEHLAALRQLVDRLYTAGRTVDDFQRQHLAEESVRTIYLHAHMDEDTFDCSRAMLCPDLVPAEPGRLIPACTYNLFYRRQDERFFITPARRDNQP